MRDTAADRATPSRAARPVGTTDRTLSHHRGLDGLRGLALLAIILYHSGADVAPGAFLSVSTFFTLSGFLITRGLLAEHDRDGAVSLRRFWTRRLRRLLPAALVAITLITLAAIWLADATQWLRLRGDALSSLLYVANWRFILIGDSYGANFASPSPFTHFWTLSIEEQFYLLLPVLLVAALVLGGGSRRRVATAVAAVAAVSVVWANVLMARGASIDRLYFGTDVRAPELLTGVLLAVWWTGRERPLSARATRTMSWLGPAAMVAMVLLWATAELSEPIFYRGGLTAYSVLTLIVIVAAMTPGTLLGRALSWRPIVWVGVVSYAAYLLHYPILLWLHQDTSLGTPARLAIALPLTFGLAAASARWLERPIRYGMPAPNTSVLVVALGSTAAVLVAIVAATTLVQPHSTIDLESAARWQRFVELTEAQQSSEAPRIAFYGDSTAVMTGRGMSEVSLEDPSTFVSSQGWAGLGCGLNTLGDRVVLGEVVAAEAECVDWLEQWTANAAEHPADVAVIQLGPWEVTDQQVEPDGEMLTIGEDPELDAFLADRLTEGIDALIEHNQMVVLVLPPPIEAGRLDGAAPSTEFAESDPARMERFTQIVAEVAGRYESDHVGVIDLAGWVETQDDSKLRPDGIHFSDDSAITAAQWLGPELVELYSAATGNTTTRLESNTGP